MRLQGSYLIKCAVQRPVIGAIVGLTVFGGLLASSVHADPANDAMAKLNELSRQAEQTTEAMHSAQLDLVNKLTVQQDAEGRHSSDLAAADSARAQLATFQSAVDKFAAAQYMGGRTDGLSAMLTAGSPQGLIGQLSVQKVMATEMSAQMQNYQTVGQQAAEAEAASAKSAADARTAAEQASAARADLQSKQSQLNLQIAIVKSQYLVLSPNQRVALAAPGPVPDMAVLADGPMPPLPDALPPGEGLREGVPAGDIAPPEAALAPGTGEGAIAVQAALTRIGSPYSWGASGPGQFDCSGLVMWSFQQAGISLPHSSQALANGGQPVALSDLQPGDVVTYYSDASHAGIYVGDGMMVHASTYGTPVRVVPVNNAPIYNARRY